MICEHISPSRADIYEDCALRYYARYHEKKRYPATKPIDIGILTHTAKEIYYNPDFNYTVEESFRMAMEKHSCRDFQDFKEALRMVEASIARLPKEFLNIIETEVVFDYIFESGLNINGRIDLLTMPYPSTIEIIDDKSGKYVSSYDEIRNSNQANIYGLWIFSDPRFKNISNYKFTINYLREGVFKTVDISREEIMVYKEYLEYLVDQILRNEDPQPTMNRFCWNCEIRQRCAPYKNMIRTAMVGDNFVDIDKEEAGHEHIADAITYLSSGIKSMKKEKEVLDKWMLNIIDKNNFESFDTETKTISTAQKNMTQYDMDTVKRLSLSRGNFNKVFTVKHGSIQFEFSKDRDALIALEGMSSVVKSKPYITIKNRRIIKNKD